jgi:cytochrome oxidase assembly protein ShyY1
MIYLGLIAIVCLTALTMIAFTMALLYWHLKRKKKKQRLLIIKRSINNDKKE